MNSHLAAKSPVFAVNQPKIEFLSVYFGAFMHSTLYRAEKKAAPESKTVLLNYYRQQVQVPTTVASQ
jgi:hypothetical protein